MQNNAELLLKIINDLLDISRIESGEVELEFTHFTLSSIFGDVYLMFSNNASEKHLNLTIQDETNEQFFYGDRTRIQQIIVNLVSNALKFTQKGGIEIHAKAECLQQNECTVILEIKDTGIGIAKEKLSVIFNKFTQADATITRRFGGSGLGLSIAKTLAKLMGGDITVQTKLGEGSVFRVTLLLKKGVANKVDIAAPSEKKGEMPLMHAGAVLIVEDYAPNVMVASMMLEELGFSSVIAESGQAAIDSVAAATHPFLAILMDVQMYGMDGLETTRRIRQLESRKGFKHTIIGVTAHALAGDRERCIAAGMDDYIAKPIHPDILAAKLTSLMENV